MGMFTLAWIGFVQDFNFNSLNQNAKSLERLNFLFDNLRKIFRKSCMA
jgi:hypothetical protein